MKTLHSGQFTASSCQSKTGDPVAGRCHRDGDGAIDRCRPHVSPAGSPLIRHGDELHCGTESLKQTAFGRARG